MKWISVNKKKPEHKSYIIVYSKEHGVAPSRYFNWEHIQNEYFSDLKEHPDFDDQIDGVTFWMPLPELPKDQE